MRRTSFFRTLPLLFAAACGGSDGGTEPTTPEPTTITIEQGSIALTSIGGTATLTATVRDQEGRPINVTVTWSSSDPGVVSVDASGRVTALENGSARITATAGTLSASVTVTVDQVVSALLLVSGGDQSAVVGQELADPVVVRAEDQGGTPVAGASVTFTPSAGGEVGDGTVTADASGEAGTTWTLGTEAGEQILTVASDGRDLDVAATGTPDEPVALVKVSGDAQVGDINVPLPEPVVVRVVDQFGNGVEGGEVTFEVTAGGGTVGADQVETGSDGTAEVIWTMGPIVGDAALTATAGAFDPVGFTATALLPAPDLALGELTLEPERPTSFDPVTVSFTVANQGSVTTGEAVSLRLLVDGEVAVQQVVEPLAPSAVEEVELMVEALEPGTRTLRVDVDGEDELEERDETNNARETSLDVEEQTALTEGDPIENVGATVGTELLFGFRLPAEAGSIEFRLRSGNPNQDADLYVHHGERPASRDEYECVSGAIDSNETCRFEAAETGVYHVLVHAFGTFSGATLSVTTGLEVLPFDIELVFITPGSSSQNEMFRIASDRWEDVLPVDIIDIPFDFQPFPANQCIQGQDQITETIDDIRIYVDIIAIDGVGRVLGRAGPCVVRSVGGLPVVGLMQFDVADVDNLESSGALRDVILHEMGHVLGIGTVWRDEDIDLLRNPSNGSGNADTHFVGPLAIEAFDAAGGVNYTGAKVPVENVGGAGSINGHWREAVLEEELMTSQFIGGNLAPLSAITVQSLADVGYKVEVTAADAYAKVFTAPAAAPDPTQVIDFGDDIWRGPVYEVDARGSVVKVRRR